MLQLVRSVNNKIDLLFVPHLSSIERGIYSTHYITIKKIELENIYNIYRQYYKGCEFVKIVDQAYPKLSQVKQTNDCLISIFLSSDQDEDSNLVVMSALDNLVKGASGQAIQNMNIMFGLEESRGLLKIT